MEVVVRPAVATCLVLFAILVAVSTSRSDDLDGVVPANPIVGEPITGEAVVPNGGDETPTKDPFAPYDIGPPEEAIRYDELTPEEQATANGARNLDARVLDGYRSAVLQRSGAVAAEVAARQLGVDNLDAVGVVP